MRMIMLNDEELRYVNNTGHCPTCKEGELIGGPRGGSSQNFRCQNCGQEFNLGLNPNFPGPYVWVGDNITPLKGKDDNRKELYTGKLLSSRFTSTFGT